MIASNVIQFPSQLESLENEAQENLDKSIHHFKTFTATLNAIQESGLYIKEYGTWSAYLKQRWGMAESTFRNKRLNADIAEMIGVIVADVTLEESQARTIRKRLSALAPADKVMQAEIYIRAYEETGKAIPTEKELSLVAETVKRVKKEDILTIDGVDYNAKDLVIEGNIKQELYELKQRKIAHIEANTGITSKRLDTPRQEAIEAFFKAQGLEVPQGFDFVMFWKESTRD